MDVATTHHIDSSEADAQGGTHDYYYEYDLYRFSEGDAVLIARSYIDTPVTASFLNIELRGNARRLCRADLKTPLLAAAAAYLRTAGKRELLWLSGRGNGYEPLP